MSSPERILAEELARITSRRQFLNRAMVWTFAAVSGVAATGSFTRSAGAHTQNGQAHCDNRRPLSFGCEPPNNQNFCTGCNGHACPPGYSWTSYWGYASACWCSGTIGGHYFICCDCHPNGGSHSDDCGCTSCVGNCTGPEMKNFAQAA